MKIETLKKDNKKKYIIASIVVIAIVITITYISTRAKYRVTSNAQLASGTINYSLSDLEITSIKLQTSEGNYEETENIPTYGYQLNNELSECIVKGEKQEVEITYEEGKIGISNISKKGNKCSIYFDQLFKGSGTEENPYLLSHIEDLVELSKDVNSGNTYSEKHFKLESTLDFNNNASYKDATSTKYGDYNGDGTIEDIKTEVTTNDGFNPIGNNVNSISFQGIFDGNNKKIQNIHIENTNKNKALGLFSRVENATIKNLEVIGNIKLLQINDGGLIAGQINNAIIENSHSTGTITSSFGDYSIGGLVGSLFGKNNIIKNSYNESNLTNSNNVGGLVGFVSANSALTIENSYNKGTITNNLGSHVGGLLAYISQSSSIIINNSYNGGSIISNSTNESFIGGLVGRIFGELNIDSSHNSGIVSVKNGRAGGLAGNAETNGILKINNSFNTNEISGNIYIGGLVGSSRANITIINKSYNTGNVTGVNAIIYSGAGGLIAISSSSVETVLNSYNTGNVSGADYSLGICSDIKVINSYNVGNVQGRANSSGITITGLGADNIYLNNIYSIGTLQGGYTYSIYYRYDDNTTYSILNAYHDSTTIGSNVSSDGLHAMSLSDMKSQTFVDTLNNNIKNINLESIDINLKGYTLSTWKLGPDGYPILNN